MTRKAWTVALVAMLALVGCGGDSEEAEDIPAPGAGATTMPGGHTHGGGAADTSCTPSGTTVSVVASGTKFQSECLAAPADQAFTVSFDNKDSGLTHNIVFLESHTATSVMFRADPFTGPGVRTFNAGPFRPGTYAFHCEIHPNAMSGAFVVK